MPDANATAAIIPTRDITSAEQLQAYLSRVASVFSGPDALQADHPEVVHIRADFDRYRQAMQHPLLKSNSTLIVDFLNKGLKLFPNQPELYLFIAEMLRQAGNAEIAIDYINRAIGLAPTLQNWHAKAAAEAAAGRTESAETTLRAVLPHDASGETAARLAHVRLLQGDDAGALALVEPDMATPSVAARVTRSTVLFQHGRFMRAEQALEGEGPHDDVDKLRRIEQVLLAPLVAELYAYARRQDADPTLVASLRDRFTATPGVAPTAEQWKDRSDALSESGDVDGALLCDRMLMTRQTALGDVEPVRSRIVDKLHALGKIRQLTRVPMRTRRAKVLVVMATHNPFEPTSQANKIIGSLRYCDFVEPTWFYLTDETRRSSVPAANRALVQMCRETLPDLVITPIQWELLPETLAEIKHIGIPIVLDCHDVWLDRIHYVERNLSSIAFGVTNGLHDFYQSFLSAPEKIRSSPGISFHPALIAPVERDIPVSFIGTANPIYSPVRRQALDYLQSRGIDVLHLGGYAGGKLLSDEEYCHCIARSRIVLNFSESPLSTNSFAYKFLKGRSIEAFTAGSLLLESHNDDTARWFTPGVHYDTFASHDELETKLRRYLNDEPLRASIAAAGHAHFDANHHPFLIWSAVIAEALGEVAGSAPASSQAQ